MSASRPADATLGARVRAARQANGLSLRALAALLEVSPATVSQIENGRTGLSVSRLSRIAEVLGLTVGQILDAPLLDVPPAPAPRLPEPAPRWRDYPPLTFDPVLTAALAEFLAIGYHGATMRGIAARCGLSVAGIYHYQPSKQHMLVALMDFTMTDLLARSRAARAEGSDPVDRFSLLVENLALYHTHRSELGFVGASEMRSFETANRQKIADLRTVQQRMVDHEVDAAVEQGRFHAEHPREAARAVVTMCTALPTWWRPGGPLSPEEVAERYVGVALDVMRYR
ncbi:helix-turn-helix domain-containing protein [Pseudonocardia sp. GCM10023141]|uniref:helix-turn-helix domain-containing protein n=1 Tax=Pseudonocardia sp. GCM10023141 TaxID=3252653 RepID=UPI00360B3964